VDRAAIEAIKAAYILLGQAVLELRGITLAKGVSIGPITGRARVDENLAAAESHIIRAGNLLDEGARLLEVEGGSPSLPDVKTSLAIRVVATDWASAHVKLQELAGCREKIACLLEAAGEEVPDDLPSRADRAEFNRRFRRPGYWIGLAVLGAAVLVFAVWFVFNARC
jgi:hypothetical protein